MYGGATSIMIGSYSWSYNPSGQYSTAQSQSGDTYCSGCAMNVSNVTITNSIAVLNATVDFGKLCAEFDALQCP